MHNEGLVIKKDQRYYELVPFRNITQTEEIQQLIKIIPALEKFYPELFEKAKEINTSIDHEAAVDRKYADGLNYLYDIIDEKIVLDFQDFYFVDRKADKTLIYISFPHIPFFISVLLIKKMYEQTNCNLLIVDNTKYMNRNVSYFKKQIENKINSEIEEILLQKDLIKTEKIFLVVCYSALIMNEFFTRRLLCYNKIIFYAPMLKNITKQQPDLRLLGISSMVPVSLFYALMSLLTDEPLGNHPMNAANRIINIDNFNCLAEDYEQGIELNEYAKPYLIYSQEDKVVNPQNSFAGHEKYIKEFCLPSDGFHLQYLRSQDLFLKCVNEIIDD